MGRFKEPVPSIMKLVKEELYQSVPCDAPIVREVYKYSLVSLARWRCAAKFKEKLDESGGCQVQIR